MKVRSKSSSIRIIKRLFANSQEDTITLEEAFRSWGRQNPESVDAHKAWLSNVMYHLKYHNLAVPVYSFGEGPRKLTKIRLTLEGKRALGRIPYLDGNEAPSDGHDLIVRSNLIPPTTINDVMKTIAKLRSDNPEYEITFDVKLKGE